jgi:hypothetical protein
MRKTYILCLVAAFAGGCAENDDAPSCAQVATHLVELVGAAPETAALPGELQREVEANAADQREAISARCERESWSADLRRCKNSATSPASAADCDRRLP